MIFIAAKQELILSCRHWRTLNVIRIGWVGGGWGLRTLQVSFINKFKTCQIVVGKSLWNTARGIKHFWTCCYRTLINRNATSCWASWHRHIVDYSPAHLVMFYSLLIRFCHHLFGVFHSSLISNVLMDRIFLHLFFTMSHYILSLSPPPPLFTAHDSKPMP